MWEFLFGYVKSCLVIWSLDVYFLDACSDAWIHMLGCLLEHQCTRLTGNQIKLDIIQYYSKYISYYNCAVLCLQSDDADAQLYPVLELSQKNWGSDSLCNFFGWGSLEMGVHSEGYME